MNIFSIIGAGVGIGSLILSNLVNTVTLTTNYDAQFDVYSNVVTANYPMRDLNNNALSAVSNAMPVTIIAPDGRGYQTLIQPGISSSFASWTSNSLSNHLYTNTLANVQAVTSETNCYRFTGYAYGFNAPTNFVINANFWLSKVPQVSSIVYQCNVVNESYISGVAISPIHVISISHVVWSVGTQLCFVDTNGQQVVRTVSAIANFYGVNTNDITVALLNTALPSSVVPMSFLPSNALNYFPSATNSSTPVRSIQFLGYNQFHKIYPVALAQWQTTQVNGGYNTYSPVSGITNYSYQIQTGDSGHPVMLLVSTNLILAGLWTYDDNGAFNYVNWQSDINYSMHYLSTNNSVGSDYQLNTVNLSAFPTFF